MVEVMKKVSVDYVVNKNFAEKEFGKGSVVLDLSETGMMGYLSPVSEWGGLKIPGSETRVLSMIGAFEGLKVFRNKGVDESYFMDSKKYRKGRRAKSYGVLKGFKWKDEEVDYDKGIECFKEWYVNEVMSRWGNMIRKLEKTSNEKNIILLYEEDSNWFDYPFLLKRMISDAA